MATHSRILACRIPGTVQWSMGLQRVRHDRVTFTHHNSNNYYYLLFLGVIFFVLRVDSYKTCWPEELREVPYIDPTYCFLFELSSCVGIYLPCGQHRRTKVEAHLLSEDTSFHYIVKPNHSQRQSNLGKTPLKYYFFQTKSSPSLHIAQSNYLDDNL